MLQNLSDALALVADPFTIMVVLLAGVFGLIMGALPGMTATLGAALLIPFTFFMDPVPAIASIISMAAMAIFAGDIPGALLRMPGTPSSAAYTADAYELTKMGKGGLALGVSLVASVIGGLLGSLVLIFIAPILGEFALNFTSFEYFWVAVLGLTAAVIVSRGRLLKGGIALMFGLLISTVGLDVTLGHPRFTFGNEQLYRGIDFIPAMIGLFGISEVLRIVTDRGEAHSIHSVGATKAKEITGKIWKFKGRVGMGAGIGGVVGAMPGAGADIAAWIAYAVTKNSSNARKLSRADRHIEPIAGASSANNAALGSAFIPMLAFGIPGDTITAILVGVLLVKGITPGPDLFLNQTDTLYAIYMIFILAQIILLIMGFLLIRVAPRVLRIPLSVLTVIIIAIAIVGAFAINNGYLEIMIMLVMGVIGFGFERANVPLAPVVLGIVLGPIVERNFMSSVIKTNWDLTQFFSRPISAVLIVLVVVFLLISPVLNIIQNRAEKQAALTGK